MKKPLLIFELVKDTGRTKVVNVLSNHSNELLGVIHWRNGWRCYVMSYENNIEMSLSCNLELDDFMGHLEKVRQRDLKKEQGK